PSTPVPWSRRPARATPSTAASRRRSPAVLRLSKRCALPAQWPASRSRGQEPHRPCPRFPKWRSCSPALERESVSIAGFDLLEFLGHLSTQLHWQRRLEQRLVVERLLVAIALRGHSLRVDGRNALGACVAIAPVGQQEACHFRRVDRVEIVIGLVLASRRVLQ